MDGLKYKKAWILATACLLINPLTSWISSFLCDDLKSLIHFSLVDITPLSVLAMAYMLIRKEAQFHRELFACIAGINVAVALLAIALLAGRVLSTNFRLDVRQVRRARTFLSDPTDTFS